MGCVSSVPAASIPLDTALEEPSASLGPTNACAPLWRVVADNLVEVVQGTLEPNVQSDHS